MLCTISSVPMPIFDYANANEELAKIVTEQYYTCCGKSICRDCICSFRKSGNMRKCSFCNAEIISKTNEERVKELIKRVDVNDAGAMTAMAANDYYHGQLGLQQDREKAIELWKQAAALGSSHANYNLAVDNRQREDLKKAKFHYEAAAMAWHEAARYNLGCIDFSSGNISK